MIEEITSNIPDKRYLILAGAIVIPLLVGMIFSRYLTHKKRKKLIDVGMYNAELEKGGSLILATGLVLVFAGAGKAIQSVMLGQEVTYSVVVAFVGVGIIVYWTVRNYQLKRGGQKDIKQKLLR